MGLSEKLCIFTVCTIKHQLKPHIHKHTKEKGKGKAKTDYLCTSNSVLHILSQNALCDEELQVVFQYRHVCVNSVTGIFRFLPDRLISVRESRVVVPTAVRMLIDWSVMWLQ